MNKGPVADKNQDISAAEALIREVSEGVIARNLSSRKRRKNSEPTTPSAVSPGPVLVPQADPVIQENTPVPPQEPIQPAPPVQPPVIHVADGTQTVVAMICYEDAASPIGQFVSRSAEALAARGHTVHIFARKALTASHAKLRVHDIGEGTASENLIERVHDFTCRAHDAFRQKLGNGTGVALMGYEWASIPVLLELSNELKLPTTLSLHSLECQRADMTSEISRRIEEVELTGLRQAGKLLLHDDKTRQAALRLAPECEGRLNIARAAFPVESFNTVTDAGAIKARYHIGPIDPLVLYVGDMDDRHSPDVLMKSVVAILKNHKQARFAFVGDGALQWPMRVHSRYLLLEYAVRILGHVGGQELFDLIQAADVICVPSRERTEDWTILAAWAAGKPVVASHHTAGHFIKHEHDGVLIYPTESSCVWGVERVLFDEELRKKLGANGKQRLDEVCGWGSVAAQLEELTGVKAVTA